MTPPSSAMPGPTDLSSLPEPVGRALEITPAAGTRERIIDITTTGRRSGRRRRIEIFFYRVDGVLYLCSGTGGATGWYANLLAEPDFTIHLKHGVRADVAVRATPVVDPEQRRVVLEAIVDDLNQPHDPGTIRPTSLQNWLSSRLMRVDVR